MNTRYPLVALGEAIRLDIDEVPVDPYASYNVAGIYSFGRGIFAREPIVGVETKYKTLNKLHAGSLVLSRLKAFEGAVAVVPDEFEGWYLSQEFPTFTCLLEMVDPEYLSYMCQWPSFWELLASESKGVGARRERVHPEHLLRIEVPLPGIDEQRRVARALRASLNDVHAAMLLAEQSERLALALDDAVEDHYFSSVAASDPISIDEVAEVRSGIQRTPARTAYSNPVRYLTVAHVQRNAINYDDLRYFEVLPEELERWRLEPEDVLIIEGNGSSTQIGRTAIFEGAPEPVVHQNHVIRLRCDKSRVLPEYLNAYLNSGVGRQQLQELSRTTSGLHTLSAGRIRRVRIPLPSLQEQRHITDELDNASLWRATFRRSSSNRAARLNAFAKALLNQAFAGLMP
jgi:type I restriction enzyme, S subunit